MHADFKFHRFNFDEYLRMANVGILRDNDRVELIDGVIYEMYPKSPWHCGTVNHLVEMLLPRLVGRAVVSCQGTLRLSDETVPKPDVAILRFRDDDYMSAHPTPADTLVLVEVADASIVYDLEDKVPRYAAAGISEVWVVDATRQLIHQFSGPHEGKYNAEQKQLSGQMLESVSIPGLQLSVAEILRTP